MLYCIVLFRRCHRLLFWFSWRTAEVPGRTAARAPLPSAPARETREGGGADEDDEDKAAQALKQLSGQQVGWREGCARVESS